jgi:hypothetical protein
VADVAVKVKNNLSAPNFDSGHPMADEKSTEPRMKASSRYRVLAFAALREMGYNDP